MLDFLFRRSALFCSHRTEATELTPSSEGAEKSANATMDMTIKQFNSACETVCYGKVDMDEEE